MATEKRYIPNPADCVWAVGEIDTHTGHMRVWPAMFDGLYFALQCADGAQRHLNCYETLAPDYPSKIFIPVYTGPPTDTPPHAGWMWKYRPENQ